MGLDIYLEKCNKRQEAAAAEKEYNTISEVNYKNFGGYSAMTEAQKEEVREMNREVAKNLGLGEYGEHLSREKINKDSEKHPKHMFKIGYFRSSYNSGGINSVLDSLGFRDLYWIFGNKEQCEFAPDWARSLVRVREVIAKFRAFMDSDIGKYRVATCDFHDFSVKCKDKKHALEMFENALKREKLTGSFSSKEGTFFMDGEKVHAIFMGGGQLGGKAVYAVIGNQKDCTEEQYQWYLDALEVVEETILYVLTQKDSEDYYFHWSG